MYRILILCFVCFIAGCMGFNADKEMPCDGDIPDEVVKFFSSSKFSKSEGIFDDKKAWSIVKGTHEDLYMPNKGKVCSRKYGWAIKVKFEPFLEYENKGYALINMFSEYRFASFKYLWIVVRKRDGKVIHKLKTEQNILGEIILDDVYYFKIGYKDQRIHCMKIGE